MGENRLLGHYFTRQPHDKYPAGSPCIAYRTPKNVLLLVFEDGNSIEILNGWAKGLEPHPNSGILEIMEFKSMQEIYKQEDERFFAELERISKCQ